MPEVPVTSILQSVPQLTAELKSLGISTGDIILVHASLRAIGKTADRGFLQALVNSVGTTGTVMAYVDFEPTSTMPHFDPQNSPAQKEYGVLAELVRTTPGAVRSLNPGASMSAIGARAQWLCSNHPLNYGYGPGSPLAKLVEADGKVLLVGSDPDQVTLLHYAEHIANLPNKRIVRTTEHIKNSSGSIDETSIEEFDTAHPVCPKMPDKLFARITNSFIQERKPRCGLVGRAQSFLLPAKQFVEFAVAKMEKEFGHNTN